MGLTTAWGAQPAGKAVIMGMMFGADLDTTGNWDNAGPFCFSEEDGCNEERRYYMTKTMQLKNNVFDAMKNSLN